MSLWTTSTSGLETALAAAIGSTLQQHTIANNLKGGQTHILHFGNGNPHNNNNHSNGVHNHSNNSNGSSGNTPHHYSNSSSSHSNHQQHTAPHHSSTSSFFGNSNPNLSHVNHNNFHSSSWSRNNICSNHKVSSEFGSQFMSVVQRHNFSRTEVQCKPKNKICLVKIHVVIDSVALLRANFFQSKEESEHMTGQCQSVCLLFDTEIVRTKFKSIFFLFFVLLFLLSLVHSTSHDLIVWVVIAIERHWEQLKSKRIFQYTNKYVMTRWNRFALKRIF